eukprot:Rmarinus@m.22958
MAINVDGESVDFNWWLVLSATVVTLLIFACSFYILVYFQHEEDKNCAYFPKAVVVFCLSLSMIIVLLLPMDVANRDSNSGLGGDIPMEDLWEAVYWLIAIMIIVVIPFSIFYYEEDDDSKAVQIKGALTATMASIFISSMLIGLLWSFAGYSLIPVERYADVHGLAGMQSNYDALVSMGPKAFCASTAYMCISDSESTEVEFQVTVAIYTVALLSILGWVFFTVFTGVGLIALPMDLISAYLYRPKQMKLDEYAKAKIALASRASNLKKIGQQLQEEGRHKRKSRKDRKLFNKFKQAVYFLEQDYERVQLEFKERGGNPLWYLWLLILGVLCLSTSLLWIVHIILYVFPEPYVDPFLNTMLEDMDNFFGLAGTLTYAVFALYLLWACIKGNMKVGLNLVFFTIHPMAVGKTFMNSFLFNCSLILLCSLPVVMFCTQAFSIYARFTAVDLIFGVATTHLQGLGVLWRDNIFIYIMFVILGLTLVYVSLHPKDKTKEEELNKDIRDREMYAV